MTDSLRDRLLNRERPVARYPCRVAPVEETEAAETAFAVARKAAMAVRSDDEKAAAEANKALAAAATARDACYEPIRLRALEPDAFEALQDAYPPAADDAEAKAKQAADEAYLHAVFLATVEGDLTEQEWTTFVHKNLSTGERNDLYNLSIAVNGRVRALNPSVPKG